MACGLLGFGPSGLNASALNTNTDVDYYSSDSSDDSADFDYEEFDDRDQRRFEREGRWQERHNTKAENDIIKDFRREFPDFCSSGRSSDRWDCLGPPET